MSKKTFRDKLLDRFDAFGHEPISPPPSTAFRPSVTAKAALSGGNGNDTLTGQSGNDTISGRGGDDLLFGGSGNDKLNGDAGLDQLIGGSGDDILTGGDGNDQMLGGAGNDRMIWNNGDDSDVMEGGADTDTAEVNGGNNGEVFTITANDPRVRFDRLSPDPFFLDIGSTEKLVVKMNGGDDKISATGNLAALIQITIDGGDGNDTILGSNGIDTLIGGNGNDFIDGQQGNDVALMGAGNDTFQWDPGDGSDTVDGGSGTDTMLFNGSAGNEIFDVAANGDHVRFTRNLGSIVMDLNDLENIQVNALGGADALTINDLTGTDAKLVSVNLSGVIGGANPDGAADIVSVNGTGQDNTITVTSSGQQTAVNGLTAKVTVDSAEALDLVSVDGAGGDDIIDASTHTGAASLRLLGGAGDDFIVGSSGNNIIGGGAGDDLLVGKAGNDAFLYSSTLDGHDVIADFDGDAAGGQDTVDLDALFDALGVAAADRAGRISLVDNGNSVTLSINADGAVGFELVAMTINTADAVTIGDDVLVGT